MESVKEFNARDGKLVSVTLTNGEWEFVVAGLSSLAEMQIKSDSDLADANKAIGQKIVDQGGFNRG